MKELARHLWRFPTGAARESLAQRFGLPNENWMQDWEYTVSDSSRIGEYLATYQNGDLTEDERFSLMEIMLDAFDGSDGLLTSPRFELALQLIEANLELHLYSVWYWASVNSELDEAFDLAPWMRRIIDRHPARFEVEQLDSHEI